MNSTNFNIRNLFLNFFAIKRIIPFLQKNYLKQKNVDAFSILRQYEADLMSRLNEIESRNPKVATGAETKVFRFYN